MATGGSPAPPDRHRRRCRDPHTWLAHRDPRPQPPCSLCAPADPPPSAVSTGLLLPAGAAVEVRLDGDGYYGMWFEATVVAFAAARGRYVVTFDGDGDTRLFAPTHVRPRPPPPALESPPPRCCFRPHDVVEAFHERGWWPGLVLSVSAGADASRSVTVAFPITREVVTYVPRLVRPRRDYVGGEWVPSRAVVAVAVGPKRGFRRYEVGEVVEVVRERKMWIPAKVANVIDEFSYIVEYSDQNREVGGGSEYLHWQFIRPAVQDLPLENEFHRRTSAKRQANFKRALASGKRPKSHVEVPFNGDEHIHDAECSCAKGSMRAQQKLTVLVQDSQNASVSKMDTPLSALEFSRTSICPPNSCSSLYGHSMHPKMVVSDNVQNQLNRKRPLLRKVYTKKRLSKKEGFEETHSLRGPLELPSTGQKIGVNEIVGSQREPSFALERSESAQQQLGRTLEDTVNANEVKYHEPLAVVPLSFESASDDIGISGSKCHEGLTAQDNRIIDVLTLVNNSFLRSAVEEMDVFKEFPQQPHFLPLQQEYPHTLQGGMAFGLMVAFDLFVRSISKTSIVDNEGSFEEKKSTLTALKSNGFDVQYFECLLDRLVRVKLEYSKHLEEQSAVQAQKLKTMRSLSRNDSLLCEVDNDIAELEKKLGLLRQKGQLIEKEKEHDEESLSRLNVVERGIEEALDDFTLQFNDILAEVKPKCLA